MSLHILLLAVAVVSGLKVVGQTTVHSKGTIMKNSRKRKANATESLPRLHVFFSRDETTVGSRSDSNNTCALIWKRKRDRKQTIVLVGLLASNNDCQTKDYRDTLDRFKRKAKETGSERLVDALEIVEVTKGGQQNHKDQNLWWLQFFGNDKMLDTDQYQCVRFGRDTKGRRTKCQFSTKNIECDSEWSLILDVLNHCDSIEQTVKSGNIPDVIPNDGLKSTTGDSTTTSNDQVETNDSEKTHSFFAPLSKSMTVLHLQNLNSMGLSSMSIVRFIQAYLALRNNTTPTNNTMRTKNQLIPSQIDLSKERVAKWNAFLSALFDMLLGFGVGTILVYLLLQPERLEHTLNQNISFKQTAFQFLKDKISWLETFPAGFKLNEQLTQTMGGGIRSLLDRHGGFLQVTLWNPEIGRDCLVPALAAMATLGGWTTVLALLLDLCRLEILHATVLAVGFRKLYQMELFLLSAFFRLFRGKKRNILRQRTDSMKYDSMQLLVGTLAFCVCVFLWTTVMVYYTFFWICNLVLHLPLMVCSVLYLLSRSFPFGSLLFRISKPHWFPKDLYLQTTEIHVDSNAFVQTGELVPILESPSSILVGPIGGSLKGLLNWFLVTTLETLCPRSSHQSHSFLPPTLLVDNDKL